ncbi:MAG: CidA/LrgA family protein [Hyphomicrobiales bacterium]|nr:CidA/LrgA family protein [Hyphomicrobiales bacterium]
MIPALAALLLCQLAGEIVARGLGLPVPGPVIGLIFLALGLAVYLRRPDAKPIEETRLGETASQLLASLGLLFVPAGVGVVQQLPRIAEHALAIVVALVGSTLVTLLATVYVFLVVKRLTGDAE